MKGHCPLYIPIFLILSLCSGTLQAQMGFDLDIKKPEPYDNRTLKAEKTGDKKLKLHKRILQNTVTHYNYFFNAKNKLNEVIDRAKAGHKDDYADLLPFYNYSLEATTGDKEELDSIIYKAKTGIVLHDLRNDWIDDLYVLWGAAYYLQQQYDSAYQMFQFINYAFADKEKDGYYKYIGSRMDGNSATSIASKEDNRFPRGLISDPPSRNNALIWQIRTFIQSNAMAEAGSLMATLKNDPHFPERLHSQLEEVQAYYYYKQARWDSAAFHLSQALDVAATKQEKARWEYLIGQLYEKAALHEKAAGYYEKSIVHTTDPVMDIWARLNLIRINKEGGENIIDKNIAELIKMARRDKYTDYRDVIYYMAAQMELTRNNYPKAQEYFLKAASYKSGNLRPNNQGFLHLADLYYSQKNYIQASQFYDSVKIENMPTAEAERISDRKVMLSRLVAQAGVVDRQDSLQRIATLPEKERDDHIKRIVRQLRRQQGLKEEGATMAPITAAGAASATDPFRTNSKGDWYFYNAATKTQGAAAFQQTWGKRPNTDNWRRSGNVVAQLRSGIPNNTRGEVATGIADPALALTFEGMLANLPLSEQQVQASNDSIVTALYALGHIYINDVEDFEAAIKTFESLRQRFPGFEPKDEVLFQLYYSYSKAGNTAKAAEIKNLLASQYPGSRYTAIVTTGTDPETTKAGTAVTKTYEGIYNMFIEGRFAEAKEAKRVADSTYKTNYWSPQLLYIEAVYHIKGREDSVAKNILNTLVAQNAGLPIADKATTLIDVLNRRQQIEDELTNLQIEPRTEEVKPPVETIVQKPVEKEKVEEVAADPVITNRTGSVNKDANDKKNTATINQPNIKAGKETIAIKPFEHKVSTSYTYNPDAPHSVVVILDKVDVVYGNEARNAFNRYNREKYYNKPLQINLIQLNDDTKLLIISDFINIQATVDYLQKTKALAATEVVPWLKSDKYSFTLISEANLQLLQENKDLKLYQKFLDQNLPVKF